MRRTAPVSPSKRRSTPPLAVDQRTGPADAGDSVSAPFMAAPIGFTDDHVAPSSVLRITCWKSAAYNVLGFALDASMDKVMKDDAGRSRNTHVLPPSELRYTWLATRT